MGENYLFRRIQKFGTGGGRGRNRRRRSLFYCESGPPGHGYFSLQLRGTRVVAAASAQFIRHVPPKFSTSPIRSRSQCTGARPSARPPTRSRTRQTKLLFVRARDKTRKQTALACNSCVTFSSFCERHKSRDAPAAGRRSARLVRSADRPVGRSNARGHMFPYDNGATG